MRKCFQCKCLASSLPIKLVFVHAKSLGLVSGLKYSQVIFRKDRDILVSAIQQTINFNRNHKNQFKGTIKQLFLKIITNLIVAKVALNLFVCLQPTTKGKI